MADNDEPCFTYSIGINKQLQLPDIVIVGLKREIAQWIAQEYNHRLKQGEIFEVGKLYSGFLEGFDICFEKVSKRHYPDYFGWGIWLHQGDKFEVLQLIWPSTAGFWPWDDSNKTSDYYKWAQPILNETGFLEALKSSQGVQERQIGLQFTTTSEL